MDLRDAAEGYGYEVRMLIATLNGLSGIAPGGKPSPDPTAALIHNSMLEGFLLHARVLIEFHISPYNDDIRPVMFLQDAVADDGTVKQLRTVKTRIDKRLMHFTTARQGAFDGWKPIPIARDIVEIVEAFIGDVVARYPDREQWFTDALEACSVFHADYG